MPISREGYRKYTIDEKVSALLRSIVQDGCHDFKKETIDVIFIEKSVDGVNIGKICSKWAFRILGSLDNDNKMQVKLLFLLYVLYIKGKNPDTNKAWHLVWMKEGCPLFSNKINNKLAIFI